MEKRKLPHLVYNWLSAVGAIVALASGLIIIFLLVINFIAKISSPYLGILLFMVLPGVLIAGLLLIPLGMYLRWRTLQKTGIVEERQWPLLNLNEPKQRTAVLIFLMGTLLFVLISSVGVYEGYHYTDSVLFCGVTCHTVMKPEHTAYQDSPHARVKCVECHIGSGAAWYTRSKMSGMYQVYATIADVYARPIPTPIEDLRPARETCEECHWPQYFFGSKLRQMPHYRYDRSNTSWPVTLLVKTGGEDPRVRKASGIHWHVSTGITVEYIARDKQRQDIPWVRMRNAATGKTVVYQDADKPLTKDELARLETRAVDCIDCHNRPSHNYRSPDAEIDSNIHAGLIDRSLPEIKRVAVEAMAKTYASESEAMSGIENAIRTHYQTAYPRGGAQQGRKVQDAVAATQASYRQNLFPEMKVRWADYPNNIGHFIFRGCMRCHDGRHRSADGSVITNDCRACHIIISQGPGLRQGQTDLASGLAFRHPVDIGDGWKDGGCYQCHTGVQP